MAFRAEPENDTTDFQPHSRVADTIRRFDGNLSSERFAPSGSWDGDLRTQNGEAAKRTGQRGNGKQNAGRDDIDSRPDSSNIRPQLEDLYRAKLSTRPTPTSAEAEPMQGKSRGSGLWVILILSACLLWWLFS